MREEAGEEKWEPGGLRTGKTKLTGSNLRTCAHLAAAQHCPGLQQLMACAASGAGGDQGGPARLPRPHPSTRLHDALIAATAFFRSASVCAAVTATLRIEERGG